MANGSSSMDFNAVNSGLRRIADISVSAFKTAIENQNRMMNDFSGVLSGMGLSFPSVKGHKSDCGCGCCPPKEECPPRCIAKISRSAYSGEQIIVPFRVTNRCSGPKHYRVGVRELKDDTGASAPSQPILNKSAVDLDTGQSEMILMAINLKDFREGHSYETDIVLREKDINQNICFRLLVTGFFDVPTAYPHDENKYKSHFQSWQSHFYCDPVDKDRTEGNLSVSHPTQ